MKKSLSFRDFFLWVLLLSLNDFSSNSEFLGSLMKKAKRIALPMQIEVSIENYTLKSNEFVNL